MVQKCVVVGCRSQWYPGCSLIFHSFPKDPLRRKEWLSIVKLKNTFYETSKICNKHFVPTDYIMENRLKYTAVPFFSDVMEQSELKSDAPEVSIYYTPVIHGTILPSTPSTSRCGLSDTLTMPKESLPITKASILSPTASEKNFGSDNFIGNIVSNAVERDANDLPRLREILQRNNVKSEITNTPPMKPSCLEKSVQVKLKTKREDILQKQNKHLLQKIRRQKKTINNMKSLLENIIKRNFTNTCEKLKKPPTHPRGVRYSDEVKYITITDSVPRRTR